MTSGSSRIASSYDAAAQPYAEHLYDELAHKPLDRHLLDRFAEEVAPRGPVADVGCGPGHVATYLAARGVEVTGVDLSPEMVRCASLRNPQVAFRVGDMNALEFADGSLAGILAFYSIVHSAPEQLPALFSGFRRLLRPEGLLFLAFHAGERIVHVDELFGAPVSLDFQFHETAAVVQALSAAGLNAIEVTEREPYPDVEYPSCRAYVLAKVV